MKSKHALKKLTPYQQGKQTEEVKREYGLDRIIKLASNENPFGYSDQVKNSLSLDHGLNTYPDGHTSELRNALAKKLNVEEDQIIFGGGSDELIQIISRAFLYPGVNTVMAAPTFPQYKHNATIEGATIKEIPTLDGYHDLKGMLQAIDENTSVVWLCTPNNPTGSLIPKEELYDFMNKCPKHVLVVLDEAYFEYVETEFDSKIIEHFSDFPNLISLRTFSKAYGLAGLRIGYGIANKELIAKLEVARGPFNTSSLAQKAALIALSDDEFIEETVQRNKAIRENLQQFLKDLGWHSYDSQTNFILITTPIDGEEMFNYLLERGYIVRPVKVLEDSNKIRVTIGSEEEMDIFKDLLQHLHSSVSKEIKS
ncbi:histidinol-phosphate transaminase [Virgibacillus alimentarius]|nr:MULTISPECIES: histidinol-phosphate transaminase [Virgibacillus]HLR66322.1 histidinol-phosphate transaminase [Virgibacillus sp.]